MAVRPGWVAATLAEDIRLEIAAILAKGYLRLLARKAAPMAPHGPQELSEIAPDGLDVVGEESVHGDG